MKEIQEILEKLPYSNLWDEWDIEKVDQAEQDIKVWIKENMPKKKKGEINNKNLRDFNDGYNQAISDCMKAMGL